MYHALIIDDNMIISRAIQQYLEPLGFRSFDHSWTERQALAAAGRRRPDLIVIGDDMEVGSALNAAKTIVSAGFVPVLMVSGDPARTKERLEHATIEAGPFALSEIETAVDLAFGRGRAIEAPIPEQSAACAAGKSRSGCHVNRSSLLRDVEPLRRNEVEGRVR